MDFHILGVHRVHPAARHDVCSSRQPVLVHLFEEFHVLKEIELFLTSLLLGRHCHVLVSLEQTFRRRLRAVTPFMELRLCAQLFHGFVSIQLQHQ